MGHFRRALKLRVSHVHKACTLAVTRASGICTVMGGLGPVVLQHSKVDRLLTLPGIDVSFVLVSFYDLMVRSYMSSVARPDSP